jgi:hypothetical protein
MLFESDYSRLRQEDVRERLFLSHGEFIKQAIKLLVASKMGRVTDLLTSSMRHK